MINSFLDVACLESGIMNLVLSCFSINELIEEVLQEHRFIYTNHPFYFVPCQPLIVTADREKIEHVITNLLGNAVKYSQVGKTVEVGCTLVDNNVQVYVKDDGIGINAEEIPRLFDRFYRAENHNNKISGFGIGLYLSAEIIKMHNGQIRVESEPGKGSTFYFTLPQK